MNPVLERIITARAVTGGISLKPLHSHMTSAGGALIQRVIDQVRPSVTLEVGMAYGVSTLFICDALSRLPHPATHVVIDPNQSTDWNGIGLRNAQEAGYHSMLRLYEEPSEFVLPRLVAEGLRIDVALIDGWHTFDHTLLDFFYISRMLSIGGVVIFDDADLPSVARVVRLALTYPAYEVFDAPLDHRPTRLGRLRRQLRRLGPVARLIRPEVLTPAWEIGIAARCVAIKKVAPDERAWNWHEDF